MRSVLAAALVAALAALATPAFAQDPPKEPDAAPAKKPVDDPLAKYFEALEATKLVDVESGNLDTLKRELQIAEDMLRDGTFVNAAVALYAIVKSPRYAAFTDFVDLHSTAAEFVEQRYPGATVATAWPLSAVLQRPELGYVQRRLAVRGLLDFGRDQVSALEPGSVDVFILYSRDWEPSYSFMRIEPVRKFWARFFQ